MVSVNLVDVEKKRRLSDASESTLVYFDDPNNLQDYSSNQRHGSTEIEIDSSSYVNLSHLVDQVFFNLSDTVGS
jgi:hypothetical protein